MHLAVTQMKDLLQQIGISMDFIADDPNLVASLKVLKDLGALVEDAANKPVDNSKYVSLLRSRLAEWLAKTEQLMDIVSEIDSNVVDHFIEPFGELHAAVKQCLSEASVMRPVEAVDASEVTAHSLRQVILMLNCQVAIAMSQQKTTRLTTL